MPYTSDEMQPVETSYSIVDDEAPAIDENLRNEYLELLSQLPAEQQGKFQPNASWDNNKYTAGIKYLKTKLK